MTKSQRKAEAAVVRAAMRFSRLWDKHLSLDKHQVRDQLYVLDGRCARLSAARKRGAG